MNRPYFSIIIPVYNTEQYLSSCLDSVLNQNFKDYEIICINDGSNDGSLKLLEEYRLKFPSVIKIITKENGGLSSARNVGLDNAKGQYLLFLDSDDEIEPNSLDTLFKKSKNHNYDMIMFSFKNIFSNRVTLSRSGFNDQELSKEDIKKVILNQLRHDYISCIGSKIYKVDLIKKSHLSFDDKYKYNEDVAFALQSLLLAEKVLCIDDTIYDYKRRESGSIMTSYRNNMFESIMRARELYINFLCGFDSNKESLQNTNFCKVIIGGIFDSLRNERLFANFKKFREMSKSISRSEIFKKTFEYSKKYKKDVSFKKYLYILFIKIGANLPLWVLSK